MRVPGYSSTTDTVDPAKQSLSTDYARCNMFYNTLTSLDGKLNPQPGLSVFETPAGVYTDLIVRLDSPRTGNQDFALALKHLMDREQMRDAICRVSPPSGRPKWRS